MEAQSLDGTLRWEKTFEVNDLKMQMWQIELENARWIDPVTGLTWMRRDNGTTVTWVEATDCCQNLNFSGQAGDSGEGER